MVICYPPSLSSSILVYEVGWRSFGFVYEVRPFGKEVIVSCFYAENGAPIAGEDIEKASLGLYLDIYCKFLSQRPIANVKLLFDVSHIVGDIVTLVIRSIIDDLDHFCAHVEGDATAWKIREADIILSMEWELGDCWEVGERLDLVGECKNWENQEKAGTQGHNLK